MKLLSKIFAVAVSLSVAFSAHAQAESVLDEEQVSEIYLDRVFLEDEINNAEEADNRILELTLKTTPLWNDVQTSLGKTSWGVVAMGGRKTANANAIPIYVIDAGVGNHYDLLNITKRLATSVPPTFFLPPPSGVGCFSHATGVAGVISASSNNPNQFVSYGLYEKAPIVSIAMGETYDSNNNCVYSPNGSDNNKIRLLLKGLQEAYYQILISGRMGVVNISYNGYKYFHNTNVHNEIIKLTTPSGSYKGAFIAISAGNEYDSDACDYAYDPGNHTALANDGIMVVGAFDEYGERATGFNGWPGQDSNYGSCVDVWAPGKRIYMPFGGSSFFSQDQHGTALYNGHDYIDGTSFSSAFIAAAASYVATVYGLTTPQAVEQKIRSFMRPVGTLYGQVLMSPLLP